jgi:CO/xanthine dehydrogenase Mo-binding subunit
MEPPNAMSQDRPDDDALATVSPATPSDVSRRRFLQSAAAAAALGATPHLHANALGVRGIGEIGITGVPAAIANAVYHATGTRVRDLPITLDKVMSQMNTTA